MAKYHENLLKGSTLSLLSIVKFFSPLKTKMILKTPNETFLRITRYISPIMYISPNYVYLAKLCISFQTLNISPNSAHIATLHIWPNSAHPAKLCTFGQTAHPAKLGTSRQTWHIPPNSAHPSKLCKPTKLCSSTNICKSAKLFLNVMLICWIAIYSKL